MSPPKIPSLGAWDALWQQGDKDDDGVVSQGPVTALDCHDSYLRSEGGGLHLVGLGLDGLTPREYFNRSEKDQTRNRLNF